MTMWKLIGSSVKQLASLVHQTLVLSSLTQLLPQSCCCTQTRLLPAGTPTTLSTQLPVCASSVDAILTAAHILIAVSFLKGAMLSLARIPSSEGSLGYTKLPSFLPAANSRNFDQKLHQATSVGIHSRDEPIRLAILLSHKTSTTVLSPLSCTPGSCLQAFERGQHQHCKVQVHAVATALARVEQRGDFQPILSSEAPWQRGRPRSP